MDLEWMKKIDERLTRFEERFERIESMLMTITTPEPTSKVPTVVYETPTKKVKWNRRQSVDPMWSDECRPVKKKIIFPCRECQEWYEQTGIEMTCKHAARKRPTKKPAFASEEDERKFWDLGFDSEESPLVESNKFQRTPPFSQETF